MKQQLERLGPEIDALDGVLGNDSPLSQGSNGRALMTSP